MRGALAKDWKDNRHRLFKELYKVECSREDNIEDHPPGIPKEQWAAFIDYRLEPKTMVIKINFISRSFIFDYIN